MSNVIPFPVKAPRGGDTCTTLLGRTVALHRRAQSDVFWLKENAEFLNISTAIGKNLTSETLGLYQDFYDSVEEQLRFYPQYYRFFLSMVLDLEDLGLPGAKGDALCHWSAAAKFAEAELSDLQRAEARRLLARRGAGGPADAALDARLRRFVGRADTFAVPNKKAAYELTHIVFYLSDYGARDPQLDAAALRSLEFAGLIAYLDENHDLLAEIVTAMHFAGLHPSPIWERAVARAHRSIRPQEGDPRRPAMDAYHAFMVTGWACAVRGKAAFDTELPDGAVHFAPEPKTGGALRPLSECLFHMGAARQREWSGMRGRIVPLLSADAQAIISNAEESTSAFDSFFSAFARAM